MLKRILKTNGLKIAALAVLLLGLTAPPVLAVWTNVLAEHFSNSIPSWPWGNWTIYPYPPPGPPYSWGPQNTVYYTPSSDNQSLWCVGKPLTMTPGVNWYPINTNSWTRWGAINLNQINGYPVAAARASFRFLCEATPTGDYFRWGANPNNSWQMPNEVNRYYSTSNQWYGTVMDFDSLPGPGGQTVSLIGDDSVWLMFHFQSDGSQGEHQNGAFIDEVFIAIDDGRMDLYQINASFATLDSIPFNDTLAIVGDTLRFAFRWGVDGSGNTPDFNINCYVDDHLHYTERRNAHVGTQTNFSDTTFSGIWIVPEPPDTHEVVWVLDADNEIDEPDENNNLASFDFQTAYPNVAPAIDLMTPNWGDTTASTFWIKWTDEDPDDNAAISLFWNEDSGGQYGYFIGSMTEDDLTDSLNWNVNTPYPVPEDSAVWIIAQISDGEATYWDHSDGPIVVNRQWSIAPSISVLSPSLGDTANTQFWIKWDDADPDNNSTINLYWDTDDVGNVGTLIVQNLHEDDLVDSFLWGNLIPLPEQPVWVFAKIWDPGHTLYDYSDGPLVIWHSGAWNFTPSIDLTHPLAGDTANAQYLITWTDNDSDDNAIISLFWDTDNLGNEGEPIPNAQAISENGTPNSFLWDISGMDSGSVWVLARIADETDTVYNYSDGPLAIDHSFGVNDLPWIQILRPITGDSAETSFLITWLDGDPDNDATINLYYDQDESGHNGNLIVANLNEDDPADSFLWNVAALPADDYWVYAAISDTDTTIYDYSDSPLTVYQPSGVRPWTGGSIPQEFALADPYPNPFNNSTMIRLAVPRAAEIDVKIFNFSGRLQDHPFQGRLSAGYHEIAWAPTHLPSGIYLVQMSAPGVQLRAKVVLLK